VPRYVSNEESENPAACTAAVQTVEITIIFVEGQFSTDKMKITVSGAGKHTYYRLNKTIESFTKCI